MPYMYALYVCLICMPYMYALYVCLICIVWLSLIVELLLTRPTIFLSLSLSSFLLPGPPSLSPVVSHSSPPLPPSLHPLPVSFPLFPSTLFPSLSLSLPLFPFLSLSLTHSETNQELGRWESAASLPPPAISTGLFRSLLSCTLVSFVMYIGLFCDGRWVCWVSSEMLVMSKSPRTYAHQGSIHIRHTYKAYI